MYCQSIMHVNFEITEISRSPVFSEWYFLGHTVELYFSLYFCRLVSMRNSCSGFLSVNFRSAQYRNKTSCFRRLSRTIWVYKSSLILAGPLAEVTANSAGLI